MAGLHLYSSCKVVLLLALASLPLQVLSFSSTRALTSQRERHSVLSPLDLSSEDPSTDDDEEEKDPTGPSSTNVLGTALQPCCTDVGGTGIGTGFCRNGFCSTGEQDLGRHTVCVRVTEDFLQFSKAVGNDLSTPAPQYLFPGLKEGDIWCLCAERWAQAFQNGKAPKLFLQATHEKTLDYVSFEILREFALDKEEADKRLEDLNEQREKLKKLL